MREATKRMTNFNVNSRRRAKKRRAGGQDGGKTWIPQRFGEPGPWPFALYLPPLFMFILICPNVLAASTNDLFWPLPLLGRHSFGFRPLPGLFVLMK